MLTDANEDVVQEVGENLWDKKLQNCKKPSVILDLLFVPAGVLVAVVATYQVFLNVVLPVISGK